MLEFPEFLRLKQPPTPFLAMHVPKFKVFVFIVKIVPPKLKNPPFVWATVLLTDKTSTLKVQVPVLAKANEPPSSELEVD